MHKIYIFCLHSLKSLPGVEYPISIIQWSLETVEICTLPKSVCISYRWAVEEICNKYGRNVLVCVRWAESSDNISCSEEWGWRGGACLGTFWAEKKWVNKFDGGRRNGRDLQCTRLPLELQRWADNEATPTVSSCSLLKKSSFLLLRTKFDAVISEN